MKYQTEQLGALLCKLEKHTQLGAEEREAILRLPARAARCHAGAYLIREGDIIDSCILLKSGYAYRSKLNGYGARQIVSVHMRGDLIDLQNCLLGRAGHSAQTLTTVDVVHIPHRAILSLAEAMPAVARALWRDTLVDGSIFREWILNVGRRDARTRISHLLCELVVRQQAAGISGGPTYPWPLTQEQLGDATGLTSVHVNRTVQSMRHDGLVRVERGSMTVNDWPALQAEGDFIPAYLH